jgi:putative component of toxin-antitoxin plasmid stabilization module
VIDRLYTIDYTLYMKDKDAGRGIIILLCGGDKTTQEADIVEAKKIAKNYVLEEDEENEKN